MNCRISSGKLLVMLKTFEQINVVYLFLRRLYFGKEDIVSCSVIVE